MADLDNATKRKLEAILDMGGGYVLDFSNARFSDFIKTAVGLDPYEKYPPASKAVLLRTLWHEEPIPVVSKVVLELLEHWRVGKLVRNEEPTAAESALHDELKAQFSAEFGMARDRASIDFLAKDFGDVDLARLPKELTSQGVVESRLKEIQSCLECEAPLAVIFLVGSTLEGLLSELALAHASTYVASPEAPKVRSGVKPLVAWSLSELITVSHALGILGEDVAKHANQVRNFRNYIHPRQQLKEQFEPRMDTAQIANHVLRAALADLRRISEHEAPWSR
jgi:hypothetical protein